MMIGLSLWKKKKS